jgi:formate C-acetyltransferase
MWAIEVLCRELEAYFRKLRWEDDDAPYQARIDAIWREMDAYAAAHPACSAVRLKARLHTVIAERFEPVLFPHSPFYFEMGLRADWQGYESLCARLMALPKFGHGHDELDALAARLSADLAAGVRTLTNERGGFFQPSLFVYYVFVRMGRDVRATPDGRKAGDVLSQGAGPGRVRPPRSLTDILQSVSKVDYVDHPGNAVIDLQLPGGGRIEPQTLTAVVRAFAEMGGATIQFNCVSVDQMRDAQVHPERHRDLQVRICGLSAYFGALERGVQDEMIARAQVEV